MTNTTSTELNAIMQKLTCSLACLQATDITAQQGRLIRDAMRMVSAATKILDDPDDCEY